MMHIGEHICPGRYICNKLISADNIVKPLYQMPFECQVYENANIIKFFIQFMMSCMGICCRDLNMIISIHVISWS